MAQANRPALSDSDPVDCNFSASLNITPNSVDHQAVFDLDLSPPDNDQADLLQSNANTRNDSADELVSIADSGFARPTPPRIRKRVVTSESGASCDLSSYVPRRIPPRPRTSGIGPIHSSPNYHPAISAVQRATERQISRRQFCSFLRDAADEFTVLTVNENRRRYSIAALPTSFADQNRKRTSSFTSASSEPTQFSTSLPGSCGTARPACFAGNCSNDLSGINITAASSDQPRTPPPTARIGRPPFEFAQRDALRNVTGAFERLAMYERENENENENEGDSNG